MSDRLNMSTNSTIDHCKIPLNVTYEIFSWVMAVQFSVGLPLNLSVLYIFIFRYEATPSLARWLFPKTLNVLVGVELAVSWQELRGMFQGEWNTGRRKLELEFLNFCPDKSSADKKLLAVSVSRARWTLGRLMTENS